MKVSSEVYIQVCSNNMITMSRFQGYNGKWNVYERVKKYFQEFPFVIVELWKTHIHTGFNMGPVDIL